MDGIVQGRQDIGISFAMGLLGIVVQLNKEERKKYQVWVILGTTIPHSSTFLEIYFKTASL